MKIEAIDLAQLLGARTTAPNDKPPRPDDITARILRDALAPYDAPNPFRVGDLVRPRRGGMWKANLGVSIVRRLLPIARSEICEDSRNVLEHNMYVLSVHKTGAVYCIAVHSRDFEPYTGEVA